MLTKARIEKLIDIMTKASLPVVAYIALQVYSTDSKINDLKGRVEKLEWFLITKPQETKVSKRSYKIFDSLKYTVYEKKH